MDSEDRDTQEKDIVVNVANAGNLNKLHNAMKAAGVVGTYKGIGPFTLFAPTDEAFDKLPKGKLESLLKDKETLAAIINLHAIKGAVLAKDLEARETASLQGQMLTIAANDSGFAVNGAHISNRQEIEASNGVIHAIDAVMMPKKD
jgi:uncharacterized surface protein with fasciclin (FAS1) repeats